MIDLVLFLILMLDADTFARREYAESKLVELNLLAIPQVKQGMVEGTPEVQFRCLRILQNWVEAGKKVEILPAPQEK